MSLEAIDLSDSPVAALPLSDESCDAQSRRVGFRALSGRSYFKNAQKRRILENFIALSPEDVFDGHCVTNGQSLVNRLRNTTDAQRVKNWNSVFLADTLLDIHNFPSCSAKIRSSDLRKVKNLERSETP